MQQPVLVQPVHAVEELGRDLGCGQKYLKGSGIIFAVIVTCCSSDLLRDWTREMETSGEVWR